MLSSINGPQCMQREMSCCSVGHCSTCINLRIRNSTVLCGYTMSYSVNFQLSFTSGVLPVAKSAASVLWNHYVKESEKSEENTNIQTASSDLCISLQRFVSLFLIVLCLVLYFGLNLLLTLGSCPTRK